MREPTLLSLFDGSGGFPLAASLCGIRPVACSEVEPYPIAVTRSRFPGMKHLGDISKINGAEIEPVDVVTFGSPCQDLSVAGLRKGLRHEANGDDETTRSGLFMEAIRIIKEMREATHGKYPSFALWENVPGAFSSNKGEDFRVVLEELIKIVEPSCTVPAPDKNGWPYADCYVGDGWSLAYRVFDAQFWGVPQRRRRIHLVLDLRGERAEQVLFEREGLRGYFAESGAPWQAIAGDATDRIGAADRVGECSNGAGGQIAACLYAAYGTKWNGNGGAYNGENFVLEQHFAKDIVLDDQGGSQINVRTDGKTPTLRAEMHGNVPCVMESKVYESHPMDSRVKELEDNVSPTVSAKWHKGAADTPLVCTKEQYLFENHSQDTRYKGPLEVCPMLPAQLGTGGNNTPFVVEKDSPVYCLQGNGIDRADTAGCNGKGWNDKTCYTLNTIDRPAVVYAIDQQGGKGGANYAKDVMPTICSDSHGTPHAVAYAMQETYQKVTGPLMANSHPGSYTGQDAFSDMLVAGPECQYVDTTHADDVVRLDEVTAPLQARDYKGGKLVAVKEETPIAIDRAYFNQGQNALYDPALYEDGTNPTLVARGPNAVCVRYIVRRLTPTECARLQGFADRWGDIDPKSDFSDAEYSFWLEVRNTHARINGKAEKEYTKEQMLTWYNKLLTDSAEYKMWGNGIALPPALYCMQGIVDTLQEVDVK